MFSKNTLTASDGVALNEVEGDLPRSNNNSGSSKRADSNENGSNEEEQKRRKLLDAEISKADIKMRSDINGYLSVSDDSDRVEELNVLKSKNKQKSRKISRKEDSDKAGRGKRMDEAAKNNDEHSSSAEKHMAAAMYSGLISHSDTSDEGENLGILGRDKK